MWTVGLWCAAVAWAGPRREVADSGVGDGLAAVNQALAKAGWTPVPEGSDRYKPGHVYDERHGLWARREECFTSEPLASEYNELEVSMALQAGARVPLGMVSGEASGMRTKTLTYAHPRVEELTGRSLKPNEGCVKDLRALAATKDISAFYVVQAVLLAQVKQQECTEIAAGVKAGGAGVSAGGSQTCSVSSEGEVAVAFKTVPAGAVFGVVAAAPVAPPAPVSGGGDSWTGASGYAMRRVPAGRYVVGSPVGEAERGDDEAQHSVVLTHAVWMGATEVTQGQYRAVMGENPSGFSACGDSCPVEKVSWLDAVRYANALSAREGLESCYEVSGERVTWPRGVACSGYRLPTESEWEVAARGGGSGVYAGGNELGSLGWYGENSGERTHAVGEKAANGYGLYDMSGNVWEWVWDVYGEYPLGEVTDPQGPRDGAVRVGRGGGFASADGLARVAVRGYQAPQDCGDSLGFRLAKSNP